MSDVEIFRNTFYMLGSVLSIWDLSNKGIKILIYIFVYFLKETQRGRERMIKEEHMWGEVEGEADSL